MSGYTAQCNITAQSKGLWMHRGPCCPTEESIDEPTTSVACHRLLAHVGADAAAR